MSKCELCKEYGFVFDRKYNSADFIEGRKTSKVWIVGLNPKASKTWVDTRDTAELESFFERGKVHPYFKDFNKVSPTLIIFLVARMG